MFRMYGDFDILDLVFGCWHRHLTFPISKKPGQRRSGAAFLTGTYVVCLDCGREFPYNWKEMRIVSEEKQEVSVIQEATIPVKR